MHIVTIKIVAAAAILALGVSYNRTGVEQLNSCMWCWAAYENSICGVQPLTHAILIQLNSARH
jgi:hypothetical protein